MASIHTHYQVVKYLTFALGGVGLVLNILTLLALCLAKSQGMMASYVVLLKSLTSADLLVSLHLVLHKALREDYFDCVYTAFFYPCSPMYMSTYLTLVLIAVNLYIAIVHPFRHIQVVSYRRAVIAVVLSWAFGLVVYSLDVFRALSDHMTGELNFCRALENYRSGFFINPVKYMATLEWSWVVFMALVYSGLVYVTIIYVKIFLAAKKSLETGPEMEAGEKHHRREKRHSIYTSLLLLGTFMATYLPFCVAYTCFQVYRAIVLGAHTDEDGMAMSRLGGIYNYLEIYMEPVLVLNVICDPLIYVIRMKNIRQGFVKLFCGLRRKS